MRITMICIGSTGDVRPYIALGRELKARGHKITICAFADFEPMVLKEQMQFKPINSDVRALMANLMNGSTGVGFLKQVRDSLVDIIDPFLADLEAACDGAEAIIGTYLGQVFQSLAEVRHIPYIQTHYFPMDKNPETPISSAPGQHGGKAWNLATYDLGYLLISMMEKYYLADWREKKGMAPRKLEGNPKYELNGHIIPVLYAISPLVMPRPAAWGANIHMTGFWRDSRDVDFTPSPELAAFLAGGDKPIYVGFGSMVSGDMGETLNIVMEAIRQSGVRAILSRGWGGREIPADPNVFVADFVPHDWLFQYVAGVVHHGGAGTTAAGIQAGCPTLVIPFGGDQPFWAGRVRELGLGPKAIPRDRLTVNKLSKAFIDLTTTKKYRVAARELGERLRMEQGCVNAANIVEHELRKWLREEGREPIIVPQNDQVG